jgi:UDP-GlcNAc:undecaprenyl-phosphate/decaprenyl-phosphate GlcNAc-1-phosphate transferase
MTPWLLAFFIAFIVATGATRLVMMFGLGDKPDEARKLHSVVTPTSGGLGIITGVFAGLGYVYATGRVSLGPELIACLSLALCGGALGLVDDIKALGSKRKLAVMAVCTILFAGFGPRIETLEIMPDLSLPLGGLIGGLGTVLWLLVIINTVNFMDGANGMAMGCAGIGLLGLCALNIAHMSIGGAGGDYATLAWVGFGACCGFLVWNAAKGAIFAGDSGALFVGALSAGLGAWSVVSGVNPFGVALCFLPMLVDVILTVAMRLRRRQNVLLAHSDHAYQAAIKAGASHLYTSGRYWLQTFVCVIVASVAQAKGGWWSIGVFAAFTVVLSVLYFGTFAAIANPNMTDDEQD